MSAQAVLDVARREIGTVERPPGSNRQKYGDAYGMPGVAWCAQFVWWCFQQAGVGTLVPKSAYTPAIADHFKKIGRWGSAPRPGALALFDFPGDGVDRISHIGFVEAVNPDGSVVTIEGNTSSGAAGSQRDGGGVYRRTRRSGIVGYAYPDYGGAPAGSPAAGDPVRATQAAVHVEPDGIWGRGTDRNVSLVRDAAQGRLGDVRATQTAVGTKPDGAWGPNSARMLEATVRALQGAWGAGVDGRWGPNTDRAWSAARARYGRNL